MSDSPAKPSTTRTTGLGPKAQKLQALREKAAMARNGGKPIAAAASTAGFQGKSNFSGKKTNFQRKAT